QGAARRRREPLRSASRVARAAAREEGRRRRAVHSDAVLLRRDAPQGFPASHRGSRPSREDLHPGRGGAAALRQDRGVDAHARSRAAYPQRDRRTHGRRRRPGTRRPQSLHRAHPGDPFAARREWHPSDGLSPGRQRPRNRRALRRARWAYPLVSRPRPTTQFQQARIMTDTVISSATREVVIGFERPFVMIGERINPTGRKILAAEMGSGDFTRVEADARAQVAAGAHMLDVNAGIPLADEPAILAKAVQLVQSVTDVPLSIDSSIVAALAAGLAVYKGKPLVNSVTGEEERLESVLPLVKKYGAAVVAISNDE